MYLLTNGVEPAKSATPGNYAADPNLRLTITHWSCRDTTFTLGGGDTACLMLLLSEGQMVERQNRGVWSSKSAKPGLVTVTDPDPDETTNFAICGQVNVAKL